MNVSPNTYTVTVTETATGCTGTATVTLNPIKSFDSGGHTDPTHMWTK
ncbi:MAG: hypothetical protein R2774_05895 [Saprospiraceae bacterium]